MKRAPAKIGDIEPLLALHVAQIAGGLLTGFNATTQERSIEWATNLALDLYEKSMELLVARANVEIDELNHRIDEDERLRGSVAKGGSS